MKGMITTPSGKQTTFNPDEGVRFECSELGRHWLQLCDDDGIVLYTSEPFDCVPKEVIEAVPVNGWKLIET